jgi:hypothetical protein
VFRDGRRTNLITAKSREEARIMLIFFLKRKLPELLLSTGRVREVRVRTRLRRDVWAEAAVSTISAAETSMPICFALSIEQPKQPQHVRKFSAFPFDSYCLSTTLVRRCGQCSGLRIRTLCPIIAPKAVAHRLSGTS